MFKIAYLLDAFPVLSETFIYDEIVDNINIGNDVHVYSINKPHNLKDVDLPPLLKNKVTYLFPESKNWKIFTLFTTLLKRPIEGTLKILGLITSEECRSLSAREKVKVFLAADRLKRCGLEFDVFHCHFGQLGLYAAVLKKMGIIKSSIVVSFLGYDLSILIKERGKSYYDFLCS